MPDIVVQIAENASMRITAKDAEGQKIFSPGVTRTGALASASERVAEIVSTLPREAAERAASALAGFSSLLISEFERSFQNQRSCEVKICYGVDFVGEMDAKIVSASAEATLKVELSWHATPAK